MTWEAGYRKVLVETDSKTALSLPDQAAMTSLPLNPLKQITDLLRKDWDTQISHIGREEICAQMGLLKEA